MKEETKLWEHVLDGLSRMIHTWSLDWPRRECGTPPGSAAAWWTCKHLLQGSDSWCSAVDGCRPVCQWTPHPPGHCPLAAIYKSENEAYKYIMRKYLILARVY